LTGFNWNFAEAARSNPVAWHPCSAASTQSRTNGRGRHLSGLLRARRGLCCLCYRSVPAGAKIQARIGLASGAKGFEPRSPREKRMAVLTALIDLKALLLRENQATSSRDGATVRIPLAPSTTLLQQQDAVVARQTKAHSTSRSRTMTADAPSARARSPALSDRTDRTGQGLRQKVGQAHQGREGDLLSGRAARPNSHAEHRAYWLSSRPSNSGARSLRSRTAYLEFTLTCGS
jgi:hypothetical protein